MVEDAPPVPGNLRRGRVGPNKFKGSIQDAFRHAFDLSGGAEGLARWANQSIRVKGRTVYPNREAFYQLAAKLIPATSNVTGQVLHAHKYVAVEQREALPHAPKDQGDMGQGVEDAVQVIDFIG